MKTRSPQPRPKYRSGLVLRPQRVLDNRDAPSGIDTVPQMKIEECRVYLVDVPVKTKTDHGPDAPFPFGVSYGSMSGLKRVFLELRARKSNGGLVSGFGEASPLYPYSNETALSVYELLTLYYSGYLTGLTVAEGDRFAAKRDIDAIICKAEKYLSRERLNFSQAAIDYALHDLAGQALGIPVYALLTGEPDLSPVRACWSTNSRASVEDNIREARTYGGRGYAIKVKLNGRLEDDVRRTCAVIKAMDGQGDSVRVDANAGYSPEGYLVYARRVAGAVGEADIERINFYVEEPIDTRDRGRQAFVDLLGVSPFRLMADETLYTRDDAVFLIEECSRAGSIDKLLFNIKIQKVGGLKNAMEVAELARKHRVPIMIGGMFPSSYGKLANCHYAIAVGKVLNSDGVHPSRDYIDPDLPVILNLEKLELMADGRRVMSIFQNLPGFGGCVDLNLLQQNSIQVDWGDYYPDFRHFKI